ncbi:MAG TPA: tetratricopeptide repeat protein [Polyangiaceae bacterium]|nr:tetratricopeptide repeat protein [Polyangiaceae bacterium]
MDEDEPTVRMPLEEAAEAALPLPPRLPSPPAAPAPEPPSPSPQNTSGVTDYTSPLLTIPNAPRAPGARERYVTLGIGLFVVGVLVGVVGAAAVLRSHSAPALEAAAPHAAAPPLKSAAPRAVVPEVSKPAAEVTTKPSTLERAPAEVVAAKAESSAPIRTKPAAPGPSALPISSSKAPTCQELLGDAPVKRQNAKAALRETLLANHQLMLGNVPIAHAAYCNALVLDRSNVDRHVNLARLYLVRRDWAKAAEYGQSALELDPKSRGALGAVGDAWAALRKTDEARTAWLAAEGKPQASPRELRLIAKRNMALATRVARLNDFLLAERLYRRALLIEPDNADAMKGIAACLLKAGDFRAAEAWARRAGQLKVTRSSGDGHF